ncbi:MAG: YceI family protein [Chloroflexi bacterium]|nr:YceI family protein [Chloroflexota bacterium]
MNLKSSVRISRNAAVLVTAVAAFALLSACASAPAPTSAPTSSPLPVVTAVSQKAAQPQLEIASPLPTATTAAAAVTVTAPAKLPAQARTFKLDPSRSIARFTLNEKLMGNPVTVVGETAGVEGEISLDASAPTQTKVGILKIDARGLKTDSNRRDGAIARFILQSTQDAYQFITFTPKSIEGLPAVAEIGKPVMFKVVGDLTVRDVRAPVTFEVNATLKSADELVGVAKAQVLRSTFKLEIPSVPSVAEVTDEVALELEFVAAP